eukprot:TRINITY_DN19744_c0_g1_i1.p1 TRINITY_DN19744_c0_g1~~TRINITY_DN19744_c0_g1_i1.p1  ORF type:complete len:419 (-),score=85.78 TRINITY_DN19744_c0_g1_i1:24-1130(-)
MAVPLAPRLRGQPPTARRAFQAAVTQRCCQLLRLGWGCNSDASAAVEFVVGLQEEGLLLTPPRGVALALVDAFCGLCGLHSRSGPGGSSGGTSKGVVAAADRRLSASSSQGDGDCLVTSWRQRAGLFRRLVSRGLLENVASQVAELLESDLRRCLARPEALQELGSGSGAEALQLGTDNLAAGLEAAGSSTTAAAAARERLRELAAGVLASRRSRAVGSATAASELARRCAGGGREALDVERARRALEAVGMLPVDVPTAGSSAVETGRSTLCIAAPLRRPSSACRVAGRPLASRAGAVGACDVLPASPQRQAKLALGKSLQSPSSARTPRRPSSAVGGGFATSPRLRWSATPAGEAWRAATASALAA